MRRQVATTLCAAAVCLLLALPAQAAKDDDPEAQEGRGAKDNNSVSVGVGLVDADNDTATYLTAALRLRVGKGKGDHQDGQGDWRGKPPDTGIRGYLEPEIGYFKQSSGNGGGSDLLLGANLVGVVPLGAVDTFLGIGVDAHRIDAQLLKNVTGTGTRTKVGVNAHFGLDLFLTPAVSVFGTGRFDLVEDARNTVQTKVFLGVRARL